MKKIKLQVGKTILASHIVESDYSKQETINIFENMAYLLKNEIKSLIFKRSKNFKFK